ncbi:helix-turn-helix domain-containing protein [Sphingobacterium sp. SG20118]|uniref:AraC family transcriptional regulator n=1 Tax=Sphingobacterium sp. SG20118 TaxID=3367156 RepID=UPI0037DFC78B
MIKSYHFSLRKVEQLSSPFQHFLPKHVDAVTNYYEEKNIQMIETYMDYHSTLIYRLEAYVLEDMVLELKTDRFDFHLLYAVSAPSPIVIKKKKADDQIALPGSHCTYSYIPKNKFQIHLKAGYYRVYGLLIDVGFIRNSMLHEVAFLHEFRMAGQREKKKLYQTPIWPIKEKTPYQLQRIDQVFFHYKSKNEADIISMVFILFDIAKIKQQGLYELLDPNEELAKRVRQCIQDQVALEFSDLNLGALPERFGLKQKRLIGVHKQYFGQTPVQYLQECIIEKAKELLARYTVGETASYCGYNHTSSFSDFFHQKVGMRPGQYQQEILKRKE